MYIKTIQNHFIICTQYENNKQQRFQVDSETNPDQLPITSY